jgi:hypothetical protein
MVDRLGGRRRLLWLATFSALSGVACDDFFEVDNPTNIQDEDVENPELWEALANAPEGALALAYGDLLSLSALVSDEGAHVLSRNEAIEIDRGFMDYENVRRDPTYDDLAVAAWVADDVLQRFERLLSSSDADVRVANAAFWAGYSRVALADHFKEVPIDGGTPEPPDDVLEQSLALFDRAATIAQAAGDANLRAAALGTRARVLRSLYFERGADPTYFVSAGDAATQALAAEPEYWLDIRYQQPGSSNAVHQNFGIASTADQLEAAFTNMMDPVSGVRDPRIRHSDVVELLPNGDPYYREEKYGSRDADIPVSRWAEARLILAEYALLDGRPSDAVDEINIVRAEAGLSPFSSSDEDEILVQLQYERSVEFWLEGRRWQDQRYYGIVPPRWVEANNALGVDRRWRLSQRELDGNPHYQPVP